MYFRFRNHFFLHFSVPILLILSIPAAKIYRLTLLSAIFHESCHALAAFFLHVPILRLTILPYGCHLRLGVTDFCTEAKIAAAGPLGSLFLFLLFGRSTLGHVNFLLFLFNLIPALPLDGGRLLRLFLLKNHGTFFVNHILRRTGVAIGTLISLYSVLRPSLFCLFIAFLILSNTQPSPAPSPILQKKAVGVRRKKYFSARSTDALLTLTHYFSPYYFATFIITDRNCLVDEKSVIHHLRQNAIGNVANLLLVRSSEVPPLSR